MPSGLAEKAQILHVADRPELFYALHVLHASNSASGFRKALGDPQFPSCPARCLPWHTATAAAGRAAQHCKGGLTTCRHVVRCYCICWADIRHQQLPYTLAQQQQQAAVAAARLAGCSMASIQLPKGRSEECQELLQQLLLLSPACKPCSTAHIMSSSWFKQGLPNDFAAKNRQLHDNREQLCKQTHAQLDSIVAAVHDWPPRLAVYQQLSDQQLPSQACCCSSKCTQA
jgi:hypothetical protein